MPLLPKLFELAFKSFVLMSVVLMISLATIGSARGNTTEGDTTVEYAQPGDLAIVWAYCREGEVADLAVVKQALIEDNEDLYLGVMADPQSGCVDSRLFGLSPLQAVVVETLYKFAAKGGECVRMVLLRTVVEERLISWFKCQPPPLPVPKPGRKI